MRDFRVRTSLSLSARAVFLAVPLVAWFWAPTSRAEEAAPGGDAGTHQEPRRVYVPRQDWSAVVEDAERGVELSWERYRQLRAQAADQPAPSPLPGRLLAQSARFSLKREAERAVFTGTVRYWQPDEHWASAEFRIDDAALVKAEVQGGAVAGTEHDAFRVTTRGAGWHEMTVEIHAALVRTPQGAVVRATLPETATGALDVPIEAGEALYDLTRPGSPPLGAHTDQPITVQVALGGRPLFLGRFQRQEVVEEKTSALTAATLTDAFITAEFTRIIAHFTLRADRAPIDAFEFEVPAGALQRDIIAGAVRDYQRVAGERGGPDLMRLMFARPLLGLGDFTVIFEMPRGLDAAPAITEQPTQWRLPRLTPVRGLIGPDRGGAFEAVAVSEYRDVTRVVFSPALRGSADPEIADVPDLHRYRPVPAPAQFERLQAYFAPNSQQEEIALAPPASCFASESTAAALLVRASRRRAEAWCSSRAYFGVWEHRRPFVAELSFGVRDGETQSFALPLPEGWKVHRLEALSPGLTHDFDPARSSRVITFRTEQAWRASHGALRAALALEPDAPEQAAALDFPRLLVEDARLEESLFFLAIAPGFELRFEEQMPDGVVGPLMNSMDLGRALLQAGWTPDRFAPLAPVAAFSYEDARAGGRLHLTRQNARVQARSVVTYLSVTDERVLVRSVLVYSVTEAPNDEFAFTVPENSPQVHIETEESGLIKADSAHRRPGQRDHWAVTLHRKVAGDVIFFLDFALPLSRFEHESLPQVLPAQVTGAVSGFYGIEKNLVGRISLQARNAHPIDTEELAIWPHPALAADPSLADPRARFLLAYRFDAPDHALALTVVKHEDAPVIPLAVRQLEAHTQILPAQPTRQGEDTEGRERTLVRYLLDHAETVRIFAFALPERGVLSSALVDGRGVKVIDGGNHLGVPLGSARHAGVAQRATQSEVVLLYERTIPDFGRSGALRPALPDLSMNDSAALDATPPGGKTEPTRRAPPLIEVNWKLYLPEGYRYEACEGALAPVVREAQRPPLIVRWLKSLPGFLTNLGGSMDLAMEAAAPQATAARAGREATGEGNKSVPDWKESEKKASGDFGGVNFSADEDFAFTEKAEESRDEFADKLDAIKDELRAANGKPRTQAEGERRRERSAAEAPPQAPAKIDGPELTFTIADSESDATDITVEYDDEALGGKWERFKAQQGLRGARVRGLVSMELPLTVSSVERRFQGAGDETTLEIGYRQERWHSGWNVFWTLAAFVALLVLVERWRLSRLYTVLTLAALLTAWPALFAMTQSPTADALCLGVLLAGAVFGLQRLAKALHERFRAGATSAASLVGISLLTALLVVAAAPASRADEPRQAPPGERSTIFVPYDPSDPASLKNDPEKVFLPYRDYETLLRRAEPERFASDRERPPQAFDVLSADYRIELPEPADKREQQPVPLCQARFTIAVYAPGTVEIPLGLGGAAADAPEMTSYRGPAARPAWELLTRDGGYALSLSQRGVHEVVIPFHPGVSTHAGGHRLVFGMRRAAGAQGEVWAPRSLRVDEATLAVKGGWSKVEDGRSKKTRYRMALSAEREFSLSWSTADAGSQGDPRAMRAVVHTHYALSRFAALITASITFEVFEEGREVFEVLVPARWDVRSVTMPDTRHWALLEGENADHARVLRARRLFAATPGRYTMLLTAIDRDAASLHALALGFVRAAEGVRETGQISVAPRFAEYGEAIEVVESDGLLPMAGGQGALPMHRFRYNLHPLKLTVKLLDAPVAVNAAVRWRTEVHPARLKHAVRVDWESTGRPVYRQRVELPAGFEVDTVESVMPCDWHEQRRPERTVLTVIFERALPASSHGVIIRGVVARAEGEALTLEGLRLDPVTSVQGEWALVAPTDVDLELQSQSGVRDLPRRQVRDWAEREFWVTKHALAFGRGPVMVQGRAKTRKPTVESEALVELDVTRYGIEQQAALRWRITGAGVDSFRFALPAPLGRPVEILADATIKEQRREAVKFGERDYDLYTLILAERRLPTNIDSPAEQAATFHVDITWDRRASSASLLVWPVLHADDEGVSVQAFPGVKAGGATTYLLANHSPANVSVAQSEGLTEIEPDALAFPTDYLPLSDTHLFRLRAHGNRHRLSFQSRERKEEERQGAVIRLIDVRTVLDRQGYERAQVTYHMSNRSLQDLELELPEGAVLWSAYVVTPLESRALRPARKDARTVLIPLTKSLSGDLPFNIEVVYARFLGEPIDDLGDFEPQTPKVLNVREIDRTIWAVYLPREFQVEVEDANLSRLEYGSAYRRIWGAVRQQDQSALQSLLMHEDEEIQKRAQGNNELLEPSLDLSGTNADYFRRFPDLDVAGDLPGPRIEALTNATLRGLVQSQGDARLRWIPGGEEDDWRLRTQFEFSKDGDLYHSATTALASPWSGKRLFVWESAVEKYAIGSTEFASADDGIVEKEYQQEVQQEQLSKARKQMLGTDRGRAQRLLEQGDLAGEFGYQEMNRQSALGSNILQIEEQLKSLRQNAEQPRNAAPTPDPLAVTSPSVQSALRNAPMQQQPRMHDARDLTGQAQQFGGAWQTQSRGGAEQPDAPIPGDALNLEALNAPSRLMPQGAASTDDGAAYRYAAGPPATTAPPASRPREATAGVAPSPITAPAPATPTPEPAPSGAVGGGGQAGGFGGRRMVRGGGGGGQAREDQGPSDAAEREGRFYAGLLDEGAPVERGVPVSEWGAPQEEAKAAAALRHAKVVRGNMSLHLSLPEQGQVLYFEKAGADPSLTLSVAKPDRWRWLFGLGQVLGLLLALLLSVRYDAFARIGRSWWRAALGAMLFAALLALLSLSPVIAAIFFALFLIYVFAEPYLPRRLQAWI